MPCKRLINKTPEGLRLPCIVLNEEALIRVAASDLTVPRLRDAGVFHAGASQHHRYRIRSLQAVGVAMIASRFRPVARCMSTLVFDQRHALPLPQRIEALPKRMSKFTHAHRNALGIQFYGAASPNDIAPTSPDSEVSPLLRPWLLPQLSGGFAHNDTALSAFARGSTELDFLSLLGDAARGGAPEAATRDLAHALLRAAGFQSHDSSIRSEPQFDVTLGPAADELHVASIPNFVVAARKKRTLLVAEVKRADHDELALPQLAGEAVAAAVQDYKDNGSIVPVYPVFGLSFWGTRLLAARFVFPAAYLHGIHHRRELVQTVAVPLWGGPPVKQTIATASGRWGLNLADAEQRRQAFQLLTAIAREVDATAAGVTAMAIAAAQALAGVPRASAP